MENLFNTLSKKYKDQKKNFIVHRNYKISFKQLFDEKSSTYTYLIASARGREALIIDPVIENVNQYIQLLKELNFYLKNQL